MRIETTGSPSEADLSAVLDGLRAYNKVAGRIRVEPLAVFVRDEGGRLLGGLTGRTGADWLFIEHMWLPESIRGQAIGAELIQRAEAEAITRGCTGSWVDTFEFQAPGFYQKQGYEVFGMLEDYPAGSRRYFLQKRFTPTAAG